MKFFSQIVTVTLSDELVNKAKDFAVRVCRTTNYSDSNQNLQLKVRDDHFISKLGEEACRQVLGKYAVVSGPDYTIYAPQQKSWQDDLYIGQQGIAVKTQRRTAGERYGTSWTFQCGQLRRDTLLSRKDAWVMFVVYDDRNPHNCYVYPPFQIHELTFADPKLAKLKAHKKVVYANTLLLT